MAIEDNLTLQNESIDVTSSQATFKFEAKNTTQDAGFDVTFNIMFDNQGRTLVSEEIDAWIPQAQLDGSPTIKEFEVTTDTLPAPGGEVNACADMIDVSAVPIF